jgi:hypothetical protein
VDVPDRFGTAATSLDRAGLSVEAWLVLTHSSAVGASAPELTVQNAYGERYPYALCPSNAAVRDYALTLVSEVCDQYDVPRLMLEACGWLGFEHAGLHEKTEGADLSPAARRLLSICCCAACPTSDLAEVVRSEIDAELAGRKPAELPEAPELLAHRNTVIGELVRETKSLAGDREVLLMATDDPWVTGPDVGLDFSASKPDAYVLKCWGDVTTAVEQVKAARTDVPLIANVTVLEDRWDGVAQLLEAGASGIRYYHAGLASHTRLTRIQEAVR